MFFQKLNEIYIPKMNDPEENIEKVVKKIETLSKAVMDFTIFKQLELSDIELEIR